MKSKTPELPLWSLIVSSQLLDIVFIPFNLAGVESIMSIGEGGYGDVIIYAFYTHSFLGALLLALLAAGLAGGFWGKKSGVIIGFVVLSHWILDLIVHRPDMPILLGNAGNFPLLGFGLWESVFASILFELLIIIAGAIFYFRYALKSSGHDHRGKAITAGCAMTAFLFLSFVLNLFS
ncbi:permease [Neobacillus sp. FSL H8-0543]|uniref:permease n=1 Tax=Neobacillus sp. FSL H8-0543 TaxID=2954672 RepID=UPI0031596906